METITNHLKHEILAEAIARQRAVLENIRTRIKELTNADCNIREKDYNPHIQSHKAETLAEVSLLSDHLQLANHELDELRRIESYADQTNIAVGFGCVVVTDKTTFFISAANEELMVDGEPILGLSVTSPLYLNMRGKKVGETVRLGHMIYDIREIF